MITVVGAGPVGTHLACLLAQAGQEVRVLEEHKMIGTPVQCTGLVTSSITKILRVPKEVIVHEVGSARIFAPDTQFVEVNFGEKNIVLDRTRFDQVLADRAERAGARIYLGHQFLSADSNNISLKSKGKRIRWRRRPNEFLVGADGPLSQVAKTQGLWGKREFWLGLQVRARCRNHGIVAFYPSGGTFAWLVPESQDVARIGLLAKQNAKAKFQEFLKKFPSARILERHAGLVPIFNPSLHTQENDVFLVGDAATQVKATTGGGIVPGLLAATALASAMNGSRPEGYEVLWRRSVGHDLRLHLRMRKILDRLSLKDYNTLVHLCSSPRVRDILARTDRDNPKKLALLLVSVEPRLLGFLKYLF